MNSLSWFLYLADIFPRVSALGAITATVTLVAAVPLIGFSAETGNVNFAKTTF